MTGGPEDELMRLQDGVWSGRLKAAGAGIARGAGSLTRGMTDLLLPPLAWDSPEATASAGLTADAWSQVIFLEDPVCDGCGAAFEYDGGDFASHRCAACLAQPYAFARARAACVYDEASRGLILRFKHGDHQPFAALFARWISRSAAPLLDEADAVVPVPLHRFRLLSRRFNQAAEIARPLARRAGVEYLPDALLRVRQGTQSGRSASGRRRAVSGAFAVPPGRRAQVAGKRILLVDDVMTTGATVESCARALMRAGASAVDAAVVARVRER